MTNSEMSKFCNYYVDINSLCMFPHKYSLGLEGVLGPFGWFTRERDLTYGCVCVCVCVCVLLRYLLGNVMESHCSWILANTDA